MAPTTIPLPPNARQYWVYFTSGQQVLRTCASWAELEDELLGRGFSPADFTIIPA